ncbi:EF-hand domain-containing protein [Polaribacter vadi]|uniref:EF-hand domain-containing protein n=1 Tax=Polaribacter TaxID=52959 RepID=UPI001C08E07C|nr:MULTISPECIES: EF-hand domain-containing protein [Polaribacter]MBU3009959.1 EF-hand domain-containing protein [Polaribacter vadi]MDO6739765.1 EF-hand domain-containing protein [Polaribacter sp. 1_MG-2023]
MKKSILTVAVILLSFTAVSAQENNDDRRREGPPSAEQLIKELDKDEDGKLSLKEVKGPLKKDFKKIDTDEDGFLSKEELEKAPKPKRRERPENK